MVPSVNFFCFGSFFASLDIMVSWKKPSFYQILKDDTGSPTYQTVAPRNLQPQDLGGVIFGCTNYTFAECHDRQLFGMVLIS